MLKAKPIEKRPVRNLRWRVRSVRGMLVIAAVFLAASCTVLYLNRGSVVIATLGDEDVYDEHNYQILNPFRNRRPEVAAQEFLQTLRNDCARTLAHLVDRPERVQDTCEREHKYPLLGWELHARRDDSDSASLLRYEVERPGEGQRPTIEDPFWIWTENRDGKWRVRGYEAWY